ncbi:MAG: APC family permease, partial [Rhodospirillaceae bacterium]
IAGLVLVLVLASLNVTIITGARTNYALGRDLPAFSFLGHWNAKTSAPVRALLFQGAIALGLVLLGTLNRGGVQTIVDYLAPVFWFFFLLTGISLFVLRYKDPEAARPFRVPLYPITTVLFFVASGYLLYYSVTYTGEGALVGLVVLAAGLPFLVFARRSFKNTENARASVDAPG